MLCKGLGHRTCEGGTLPLNPFGEAFKAAKYRWTAELCCADSDGDGQTNGEELGDPMCELVGKWEAEMASTLSDALRFYDISHPGVGAHTSKNVSASIGSDACLARGTPIQKIAAGGSEHWLPHGEFFLPGEPQHDQVFFIHGFTVPTKRTTYQDFGWEFNEPVCQRGDCYLVGGEAIVNTTFLHHYILKGCEEKPARFSGDGKPEAQRVWGCEQIWGWAPGKTYTAPKIASKKLGKYKYLSVQVHYDNPNGVVGQQDFSGFKLHYTTVARPHLAGELAPFRLSMAPTVLIPPGVDRWFISSSCIVSATKPITIISASAHAHLLGREMYLHRTKADESGVHNFDIAIEDERNWYFDDQYELPLLSRAIVLNDGDHLQATCVMNSTARKQATQFGLETTDEMCWILTSFYPAEDNKVSCKGPRWTGTLGLDDFVSELPSRHPPTVSNIYTGQSDLDSGQCSRGHTALLDQCAAYSRSSAWLHQEGSSSSSELAVRCCNMLKVVEHQNCFCADEFMKEFAALFKEVANISTQVCGIDPVCRPRIATDCDECAMAGKCFTESNCVGGKLQKWCEEAASCAPCFPNKPCGTKPATQEMSREAGACTKVEMDKLGMNNTEMKMNEMDKVDMDKVMQAMMGIMSSNANCAQCLIGCDRDLACMLHCLDDELTAEIAWKPHTGSAVAPDTAALMAEPSTNTPSSAGENPMRVSETQSLPTPISSSARACVCALLTGLLVLGAILL
jgi:hypothetical protein